MDHNLNPGILTFEELIVREEVPFSSLHAAVLYFLSGRDDELPIKVIEADRRNTLLAAHLKASYRVSYADAFALALAVDLGATLVTGDPEFRTTEPVVTLLWPPRT